MISISKLRRAYFGLCRKLGFDEDTRHDFNLNTVGIESTKEWKHAHWEFAVSILQREGGQRNVRPGEPHLKADLPGARDRIPDGFDIGATGRQVNWIRDLTREIEWREEDGLARLIRKRAFAHRDAVQRDNWEGSLEMLTRDVAARTIRILRRMVVAQRAREEAAV